MRAGICRFHLNIGELLILFFYSPNEEEFVCLLSQAITRGEFVLIR